MAAYVMRRFGARVVDGFVVALPAVVAAWVALPFLETLLARRVRRLAMHELGEIRASGWDGRVARESLGDSVSVIGETIGMFVVGLMMCAFALWLLYDWFAHALFGRTLGKAVLGLRVERFDGGRPGVVCGLIRSGVINGVPLMVMVVAWMYTLAGRTDYPTAVSVAQWVVFGGLFLVLLPAHRTLHDWVSFTRVYATR
ncbi:RDD family protein [Streptomyces sp. NPDC014861]|uniref:RDD family protein n=1 Tax=Streptomyces sp. NPDC014861 TaxID=3364923 RepID=UPI0036FBB0EF